MKARFRFILISITIWLIPSIFLIVWVYPFLFDSGWKTQTILYRNKQNHNVRIEFQMEDVGALRYNKRMVRIDPGILFDQTITLPLMISFSQIP
ncbi:MAG: hypothetical protein H7259_04150 [Cytophagales bacterium]|nr:hypothetical protein [Cytophaga sp.]